MLEELIVIIIDGDVRPILDELLYSKFVKIAYCLELCMGIDVE